MPRQEWLDSAIKEIQVANGRLSYEDPHEARSIVDAVAHSMPRSANPIDRMVGRALAIEFACRTGALLHARVHRHGDHRCPFVPGAVLDKLWNRRSDDAGEMLQRWADAFFAAFDQAHPPSLAQKVSRFLRRHYDRPWTIATLGTHFRVSPSSLQRAFKREFQVSVREYQRRLRLQRACEAVGRHKIDAVALQVGYKSKKNFYQAFRKMTGMTPAAFRRLPDDRTDRLRTNFKPSVKIERQSVNDRRRRRRH